VKRAILVAILAATLAHADEPSDGTEDMITLPRAVFDKIVEEYKAQRAANILLWDKQQELNERLDNWRSGTNCT
jgi:hypothetical protein